MSSRVQTPAGAQLIHPPKRSKRPAGGPALASFLRKEIRYTNSWGLGLAAVGFICMVIVTELRFADPKGDRFNGMLMTFSGINSLSTLLLLLVCYRYYSLHVDLMRCKSTIRPEMGLSQSGMLFAFVCESAALFVHTPPFLVYPYETPLFGEGTQETVEFVIGTLDILMMARILLVVRVAQDNSSLMRQSGHLIGELANIKWDTTFITKTLLNSQPMRLVTSTLLVTLFASAYVVFLFERDGHQKMTYGDGLWLIVITMTTVGYGDLEPVHFWSRTACIISAAVGVFLTALVIGVIHAQLQLTTSQSRLMTFWNKTYLSKKRKHLAASLIQAGWLYYKAKTFGPKLRNAGKEEFKILWDLTVRFRNLRRDGGQPLSTENTTNIYIESLHTEMRTISGIVESMKDRLEHIEVPVTPSSSAESSPNPSPEPVDPNPPPHRPPPLLVVPGGGSSGSMPLPGNGPRSPTTSGVSTDEIMRLEGLVNQMADRLERHEQRAEEAHHKVQTLTTKLDAILRVLGEELVGRGNNASSSGSGSVARGGGQVRKYNQSAQPTAPALPHMTAPTVPSAPPSRVPPLIDNNRR